MKFMRRCARCSGNYGKIDYLFWDGGWLAQQGSDRDAAFFWEPGKYRDPQQRLAGGAKEQRLMMNRAGRLA